MRLYSGTSEQFIQDTIHNQIADKLKATFFTYFGYNPNDAEVSSWRNSLRALSSVFEHSNLFDYGVILEYQLPQSSKRLDCLICGRDSFSRDNAVIIELKQWEKCEAASGANEVSTWVGGSKRDMLHPSAQVGQYKMYLQDYHTAFYDGQSSVILNACAYLHNYSLTLDDALLSKKFEHILKSFPLFSQDDFNRLGTFLTQKLSTGEGIDVLRRIENSKYRPSKQLMDHVASVIEGNKEYVLLDDQLVVYDRVFSSAKEGLVDRKKSVIIVEGGPGTGKSVIAMNLMADLLKEKYNTHYATGSRAFTSTIRERLGKRSAPQLRFFNSYANAQENEIDVLILDEAHRLWHKDQSRFTRKDQRSDLPIVEQIIHAAKVSVFFVDNLQIIRPNEVGSVSYIEEHALSMQAKVFKYKLEAQFRCKGSDAFVNWINNTLDIQRTDSAIWTGTEDFDFKIFETPEDLEISLMAKATQGKKARMAAGFCWNWSDPNPDGTLRPDVVIGNFKRPWNAKSGSWKLAKGIPIEKLWAHDPNGINQIGCVYTAMGFEFDYIGVIFGNDLIHDFDTQSWEGLPGNSKDTTAKKSGDRFTEFVKNTYRVLLTRGIEGCYVYFMDKDTERFFKSRMEKRIVR
ncbi:MAG: DUF2075 domain-containing protein [Leptospirales bacterium]